MSDLLHVAAQLGYVEVRATRSGGHKLLRHAGTDSVPATGALVTIPLNVSEGRGDSTALANYQRQLFRSAGLAGGRRSGKRRKPRASGSATQAAITAAARLADAQARRLTRLAERRQRELWRYQRLMLPG